MISATIPKFTRVIDVGTDGVSLAIPGKPHDRRHVSLRLISGIGVQGRRSTLTDDPSTAAYAPTEYLCTVTTASATFETVVNGTTVNVFMSGSEGTASADRVASIINAQPVSGGQFIVARPLPGDATGTKLIVGLASGDPITSFVTGTSGPGSYTNEVYSLGCEFDLCSHDETVDIALEEFDCLSLCSEVGTSRVRVVVGSRARIHHQE